ncbi:GNAT family N-acetyltransferase [Halomonas cupida]|uniref:GNAT family N-acetyltransferase n=1 Tax=Halomonas cupida TaxID=44933 RepID=UPI003A944FC3
MELTLTPCEDLAEAGQLVSSNMAADYSRHGLVWDEQVFQANWQQWTWHWLQKGARRHGLIAWNLDSPIWYLRELQLYPDRQGLGIGRQAMMLAEQEAQRCACRYMRLRVLSGSRAEALYQRLGYQCLRRDPTPRGQLLGLQKRLFATTP